MKVIKVLIADDHKLIRSGMKSIVNTCSNISLVAECTNGKEALAYLNKYPNTIDVVLMDINMPIMNGIEATELIIKKFPRQRILALTMYSEETYIMKMINAGALGYILKDSTKEKIIEAINSVYNWDKYFSNEVSVKLINLLMEEDKNILTAKEIQILPYIVKGNTSKEISKIFNVSARTIETHRRNIRNKLRVKNTSELVSYAIRKELV